MFDDPIDRLLSRSRELTRERVSPDVSFSGSDMEDAVADIHHDVSGILDVIQRAQEGVFSPPTLSDITTLDDAYVLKLQADELQASNDSLTLEVDVLRKSIDRVEDEKRNLRQEVVRKEAALKQTLASELRQSNDETVHEMRRTISDLRTRMSLLKEQNESLRNEKRRDGDLVVSLEQLRLENDEAKGNIANLTHRSRELLAEIGRLETENSGHLDTISRLESDKRQLSQSTTDTSLAESTISRLRTELSDTHTLLTRLQTDNSELRLTMSSLESTIEDLRSENDQLLSSAATTSTSTSSLQLENDRLKERLSSSQSVIDSLKVELQDQKVDSERKTREGYQALFRDLQEVKARGLRTQQTLQLDIERLEAEVRDLTDAKRTYELERERFEEQRMRDEAKLIEAESTYNERLRQKEEEFERNCNKLHREYQQSLREQGIEVDDEEAEEERQRRLDELLLESGGFNPLEDDDPNDLGLDGRFGMGLGLGLGIEDPLANLDGIE